MEFKTCFLEAELIALANEEFRPFIAAHDPEVAEVLASGKCGPGMILSRDLHKADLSMQLKGICARAKKKDAVAYTQELAAALKAHIDAPDSPCKLLRDVSAENGFLNVFLNRTNVFSAAFAAVQRRGAAYGHSDEKKGQRLIIEHTSANPNGPLHIGNLRNSLVGAHLARLLAAVGYEVRQRYFVNDLGAQIGLTVLGYNLVYGRLEPELKIDQWIGMIYACMNTLSELQKLGMDLLEVERKLKAGTLDPEQPLENEDAKQAAKRLDMLTTIVDLYSRQPRLCEALLTECHSIPSILETSAKMNLAYERREPEAVKTFRAMVTSCLSGAQITLNTYNVKHDQFDFESELGWEGSNDRVMEAFRKSPYFVPQTQCNEEGKPEGGHVLMSNFIADAGLPTGRRGYQKDYPKFYVIRPDGSTLYTFRDVVYSLKKCSDADIVLNVIGQEQRLPQQKVALAMQILGAPVKQYHISYEVVKLTKGSMSGRRGRYVLADDLFADLRAAVGRFVLKNKPEYAEQPEVLAKITHEVAASSMKYSLLNKPLGHEIMFDVEDAANPEKVTGPFLLYNCTRLFSLFRKFEARVASEEPQYASYAPLPPVEEVDMSVLDTTEWTLLLKFVLDFPRMVYSIACPSYPAAPQLPDFAVNKLLDFCMDLVKSFSSYYSSHTILQDDTKLMFARLHLAKALQQVLINALRILTIEPLEQM